MLVHIIGDYGAGDLAFAEVAQRIKLYLPDAEPLIVYSQTSARCNFLCVEAPIPTLTCS